MNIFISYTVTHILQSLKPALKVEIWRKQLKQRMEECCFLDSSGFTPTHPSYTAQDHLSKYDIIHSGLGPLD